MNYLPNWLKSALPTIGVLAIIWFVVNIFSSIFGVSVSNLNYRSSSHGGAGDFGYGESASPAMDSVGIANMSLGKTSPSRTIPPIYPQPDVAPTDSDNRLVITHTSLAMVVSSVEDTLSQIQDSVAQAQGFVVNSSLNRPTQAATGLIEIQVPSPQRDQVVDQIRSLGLRVTSENVSGTDVTDQYEDLGAKLAVLETTKAKFEEIQSQATEIDDLLNVQRELINLQAQIDQLLGRRQYLEKSANLSRITVSLATDELALPLTPDNAWRPTLVFKEAVRSMLQSLRSLAYTLIWLGVYAVIWIPLGIIVLIIGKVLSSRLRKAKA